MYSSTRVVRLDAISESPGPAVPPKFFTNIFNSPDISVL